MQTSIKSTLLELTPSLEAQVERIAANLEKLVRRFDAGTIACDVEVGRTTRHHRNGEVYRAEINFLVNGKYLRATAKGETLAQALRAARDEMRDQLVAYKGRLESKRKKV